MVSLCVTVIVLSLFSNTTRSDESAAKEPASKSPARKPVKLPGMVIDFEKRCVDLVATVCLGEGFLELVACTKGSKEHESIVAVAARPMHVHTALLALGADEGNPAIRKQVGKEKKRWLDLPPRGDLIEVYLVLKEPDGKMTERPVSDFIERSNDRSGEIDVEHHGEKEKATKDPKFPHAFLFAGSHLRDRGKGPRQYLADLSGHVISIATFGDELLCLPSIQSRENGLLMWRVNPKHLPKVGTKVTLRLRPKKTKAANSKTSTSGSATDKDPDKDPHTGKVK
jgi:hypothetical protein